MAEERKSPGRGSTKAKPAAGRSGSQGKRPSGSGNSSPGRAATRAGGRSRSGTSAKSGSKPAAKRSKTSESPERGAKTSVKVDRGGETADSGGMNREMKRMMRRREGAADRLRRPPTVSSRKRTKPLTFLKEVRGELGRVAWPTRQEVVTYSLVVLVTVAFFMAVIYAIDFVALKGVLFLIDRGGR